MPDITVKNTFRELEEVFEECSSYGWDGDRAKPVSREVLRGARTFLELLPLGVELPQAAAEPDGEISFEWYGSPEKTVSISVGEGRKLHYAAIVGGRGVHGKTSFSAGIPDDLLALIAEVTADHTASGTVLR